VVQGLVGTGLGLGGSAEGIGDDGKTGGGLSGGVEDGGTVGIGMLKEGEGVGDWVFGGLPPEDVGGEVVGEIDGDDAELLGVGDRCLLVDPSLGGVVGSKLTGGTGFAPDLTLGFCFTVEGAGGLIHKSIWSLKTQPL
jgi:hypothetical protein